MPIIRHAGFYIVPAKEFKEIPPDFIPASDFDALRATVNWVETFLMRPDPQVGREGPVCPYTEQSVEKNLFWIAPYSNQAIDGDTAWQAVSVILEWFLSMGPSTGPDTGYKAILIIFPYLDPDRSREILVPIQRRLKPRLNPSGTLVGVAFKGSDEPGVYNPEFRPMQTPVPSMVIRNGVPRDQEVIARQLAEIRAKSQAQTSTS